MSVRPLWISIFVIALAFALRICALDLRPAHFDEGINGAFVDAMRTDGYYPYNPENYHGPLHFYAVFASQQLFGRSLWALRLVTALIGTATVALTFSFRRFLPWRVVWIAAIAMAISPAMVFYSRYAIHEAWLPFFTLLAVFGGMGIARGGRRISDLWVLAFGLMGMVLTKETYIIHWVAAGLAFAASRLLEWLSPVAPISPRPRPADLFRGPRRIESAPQGATTGTDDEDTQVGLHRAKFTARDVAKAVATCVSIVLLFYSGFGLHGEGVGGIFETFKHMFSKGTVSEQGHNKEFFYWLKLLGWYEWPAVIGLLAAPIFALRRSPILATALLAGGALLAGKGYFALRALAPEERLEDFLWPSLRLDSLTSAGVWLLMISLVSFAAAPARSAAMRWICLYGLGSITAYSLIPYKTPWCIINFLWPFFFALGQLVENICKQTDRRIVYTVGAVLAMAPLSDTFRLNFLRPTDDRDRHTYRGRYLYGDRYAYVHTALDINKLLHPIHELTRKSALHRQMRGIVMTEAYPLLWVLNDFPNVTFSAEDAHLEQYDADFLLVPENREEEIEAHLLGVYFKEQYRQRSGASDGWLYLSAERFASALPNRTPEFRPRVAQPVPDPQPGVPRP